MRRKGAPSRGFSPSRRSFLRGASVLGASLLGGGLPASTRASSPGADAFGPLQPPDANGLMLPGGFSSRVVAVAFEQPVASSSYVWHRFPDGGATFATEDGGWIYVSNSEYAAPGGVGALRFGPGGDVVDAYSILTGTVINCAGGPTPWQTWLSCEEILRGRVWECDPFAPSQGIARTALGVFKHEAAAVDPLHQRVYMTEDLPDGMLYRFAPSAYPDLTAGVLEVAEVLDPGGQGPIQLGQVRPLAWHAIPNPTPDSDGTGEIDGGVQDPLHPVVSERATRYQVEAATPFNGGEGCWYEGGVVYFSTKGDATIWKVDTDADTIEILYRRSVAPIQELAGPDNVYASSCGDVYVAEDGGNMQVVALTAGGDVKPVIEIPGDFPFSEVTGPALSPDGRRMYLSSQRGVGPQGQMGVTYEVTGPFAPTAVPLGGLWTAVLAAALGATGAWLQRRDPR